MTSARHTARVLAGAALLALLPALAACGTEHFSGSGSGVATGAPSPGGPALYGEEGPGDANPHYAENHAFQSTARLTPADRTRGAAEVKKVRQGLSALAEEGRSTEAAVFKALKGLGYADGTITTGSFGEHRTSFTVEIGRLCLDGSLDGVVNGLVNAEVHGVYLEGTGCVKPQGGH
ncbi:hypothetical protein [Streptomyces sp. ITFR-16]|uniref:hypothetical protein n=1 Tax=Streptomyces sp. ITFR-16 TaxID=3075198 RepID=UPI0028892738|nr:hypothetical protein [Streptomyces sp. ITFR-16]WNI22754.1 hypothetical protein RLT58_12825 [Streptomyces sp. ITFR-16]